MLHIHYYDYVPVHRVNDKTAQTNHMLFEYVICKQWTSQMCLIFPGTMHYGRCFEHQLYLVLNN